MVGRESVARLTADQVRFLISKKLVDQLTKNRNSDAARQTASLFREKLVTHGDFTDFDEYMLQVGIILVELKRSVDMARAMGWTPHQSKNKEYIKPAAVPKQQASKRAADKITSDSHADKKVKIEDNDKPSCAACGLFFFFFLRSLFF